jgi:5-(carboxyamino)imidazole ribonucleotide synthase
MHVGIMGAGQLGRMLALAGIPLGMRFTFFSTEPNDAAAQVGDVMVGAYDDAEALERFARAVDVVTYEFENVSVDAAERIAAISPVWPPADALRVTQDRAHEKAAFAELGIPAAPTRLVDSEDDLHAAVREIGAPGILKTRRFGYDGKGQARIMSEGDVERAWRDLGGAPLIYEGFVRFEREVSVIAVRGRDGSKRAYPVVENVHRDGILRQSVAPASGLSDEKRAAAERYAFALMDRFAYVGVFALELFDTPDGLVANEMAPRVHNSGHWTIEGAVTSQFENHVRAVCELPLGECAAVGHAAMLNIIGTFPDPARVLAVPDAHLHDYAKSERAGRKLGHITVRTDTPDALRERLDVLRSIPSLG